MDATARSRRIRGPFPTGAPGIFIDQAALIGGHAIFVGAVGGDAFGKVMLDHLERRGVALDLIRTIPDRPPGSAFVSYNDDGSRDFVFTQSSQTRPPPDRSWRDTSAC